MNILFKMLAALAAAFTLATSAFANPPARNCKTEVYMSSGATKITFEQNLPTFGGWVRSGLVYDTTCEKYGMKETGDYFKPQQKKAEVKVLGGKPIVLDPQKTYDKAEYCNNGEVYMFRVTLGTIRDLPVSGTCTLNTKMTVVMKPNV